MKASSQYPADSLRSASFLERMGGSHVATLMDYSRFNYVAQPEDSIPFGYLIPKVGPYDDFAVNWGYAEIPGATTPDEERPTLDAWARQQDDFPWLRFSTPDAGQSDAGNLTEAVGDAAAVQSTTYGMLNLGRVMNMMLDVTEQPGENYAELENLYGQAVAQWGRYMGHVAAIVGSAETQEKYGTGARFEPTPSVRQQEAVQYLGETAFHVPDIFLDQDILRRIEPTGVVARFRTQQSRVINNLLGPGQLGGGVGCEGMAGSAADGVAGLLCDLRDGVWGELDDASVRVNTYRRNVQRAFLEAVDNRLNPTEDELGRANNPAPAPWSSDIRGVMRAELQDLDSAVEQALRRAGDDMTRIHLRDIRMEIARILDTK